MSLALSSCSDTLIGDLTLPPASAADDFFSLEFNYQAINLSVAPPTNTVQLVAVPKSATGQILTSITAVPTYSVVDSFRVHVTPDGLLTAKQAGDNILVIARLTVGNVTRADTTLVCITTDAPTSPVTTFSIQPNGASTKMPLGGEMSITPLIEDGDQQPITNLLVAYKTSNRNVAGLSCCLLKNWGTGQPSMLLSGMLPGTATITATTYAFGVYMTDSTTVTVLEIPLNQFVDIMERTAIDGVTRETFFTPETVTIMAGGFVIWRNNAPGNNKTVSIIFDDPSFPDSEPIQPGTFLGDIRMFSEPGTYTFHDGQGQAIGTIVVRANTP